MKQTTKYLRILLLTILLALSGTFVYANPPDDEDPEPGVPIDGGVSLLIGAAALYGAKKWHDKNKQQDKVDK